MQQAMISIEDFQRVEIRVGRVTAALSFPEGKYSTHILWIDLGEAGGVKKSLAKLAPNYEGPELIGKQVLAVVNFPPRQIGKHLSEVLTLGVSDETGAVILLQPERAAPLGSRVH